MVHLSCAFAIAAALAFGASASGELQQTANVPLLPFAFEPFAADSEAGARIVARGPGYTLSLGGDAVAIGFPVAEKQEMKTGVMRILGADSSAKGELVEPTGSVSNTMTGEKDLRSAKASLRWPTKLARTVHHPKSSTNAAHTMQSAS
jgi:hypothetical protein